jgi:hypothetical protein
MLKHLLTCVAFASLSVSAVAQRMVLIEHFTQASCPPCASLNPALTALINANPDKVIAIKYQTSWPGTDPMNAANPQDVQTRVDYYGVDGVPNSVVNGNDVGSPSAVTQALINTQAAGTEAIKTMVNFKIIDNPGNLLDSMRVWAKVKAQTAIPAGRKLYVAAIEREISFASAPGSNGETKFEWVMKKMFPNGSGTTLPAMAAGDSLSFDFKWSIYRASAANQSAYYNLQNAAAVGFVQNNSTKEIVGSGYEEPRTWLSLAQPSSEKSLKIKSADEVSYTFNAISKVEENQQLNVVATGTGVPAGWTLSLIADGVTYPATAQIPLPGNSQKAITLKVTGPNAAVLSKKFAFKAEVNSTTILPDTKKSLTFTAITPSNILFMDYAGTATSRFGLAFQAASQTYVNLTPDETRAFGGEGLSPESVKKIYYSTGGATSGLISNLQAQMFTDYLNAGGNLFMMGQDIGNSIFGAGSTASASVKSFYNDILGASFVSTGPSTGLDVQAIATDPVMAPTLPAAISISQSTSSSPDRIEPFTGAANAAPFLAYSTGGKAGVYNSGENWKSVYVAFRMEAIGSSGTNLTFRNALIARSNAWFDNAITSTDFISGMDVLQAAYPNPAQDRLFVPVSGTAGQVTLQDISGRAVVSAGISPGTAGRIELPLDGIKPGIYFLSRTGGPVPVPVQKIVIQ